VSRPVKIVAVTVAVLVVVAAFVTVHNGGSGGYTVRVLLADAGGLESGSNVNVDGATVGRVKSLTVTKAGRALAVLELNQRAVPIGSGATAQVQIDGFFGERLMALSRGDFTSHPERSGSTIGISHSGVSVRLDDVLDSLNADAQGALAVFLNEEGTALVGRGQDVKDLLQQLPQTLPQLTSLLDQFSSNQQALGQLLDRSDQVVAEVANQRRYLTSMLRSGNSALSVLASRRDQLGATVQRAPAALKQAQTTLATLQGTAIPLAPAADGLRATAPTLVSALKEVPSFTKAAVPTLNEVSTVAPALDRLAAYGTPIVSQLVPLARELTTYSSSGLQPLTHMLADQGGAANFFGEMEGWARSTQGYDASGHIFRFGAVSNTQTFDALLAALNANGLTAAGTPKATPVSTPAKSSSGSNSSSAAPSGASTLAGTVSSTVNTVTGGVSSTVKTVTGGVAGAVNQVGSTVSGVVSKLGSRGSSKTSGSTTTGQGLQSLLGYLMGS
jgi:phospholipid/cholesterol/gamma-HCH transport system substrate-binding protein